LRVKHITQLNELLRNVESVPVAHGVIMNEDKEKEGKGFVIKDKRLFTAEGEVNKEKESRREEGKTDDTTEKKDPEGQKSKTVTLPEVDFASFVLSLSSSALLHFGDFPDPVSGKRERNLSMAKQTIDILAVLREKTRGNLSKDEEQLMDSLLHDLRIKYVEESKKG